jgi:hypothetical protein
MKKIKKDKKDKKCACKKPCTKCKCEGEVGEVKRKRGRPRKVMGDYGTTKDFKKERKERKDKKEIKVSTECAGVNGVKRGRGRPKKVREVEEVIVVPTKTFKFLGYCISCKLQIVDGDLISEGKVKCPGCDKELKVKDLAQTIDIDRPKTKKEYFQSINSQYTWHDYSASANINTIAKKEEVLLTDMEDEHIKSDEDDIISKKVIDD